MEKYMLSKLFYKNKIYRQYLIKLLGKFTNKMEKNQIKQIYHMIRRNYPDTEIMDYIQKNKPIKQFESKTMNSKKRAVRIVDQWYNFLNFVKKSHPNILPNGSESNYLDVGCNNGLITVNFGEKMGLKNDNIYGIDIEMFTVQKIIPVSGFNFQYYDGINIPYHNDFFDIITCSMVLHHVESLESLVKEIYRVLKNKGIFLIKEHDAYSIYIKWLIYIEHALYDILEYSINYQTFIENYYQHTMSKIELESILSKMGFELLGNSSGNVISLPENNSNKSYHISNPTQTYYALYIKNNQQ